MNAIPPRASVTTNRTQGSMVSVHVIEPRVSLYCRIAADPAGKIINRHRPSLHLTLFIEDEYAGLFGIDGQPTVHYDSANIGSEDLIVAGNSKVDRGLERAFELSGFIRSNFYRSTVPSGVKLVLPLAPPKDMTPQLFAQKLVQKAYSFASYTLPYSFPKPLDSPVMPHGEYNSSSYVAGLLNSVMGQVPSIQTPGYQTPGWETPIPASYFKGEAAG